MDTNNTGPGVAPHQLHFREFVQAGSPAPFRGWRLEKEDAMRYWQSLKPGPIEFDPIKTGKRGSTFGEDGLRLTGSRRFIDSILARIKDMMQYENPNTKLNVVYRQVQYKGSETPDKSSSFVFYAQAKERDSTRTPGLPHGPTDPLKAATPAAKPPAPPVPTPLG